MPPTQRIILVEDDQDLRESIITYLSLAGHDIDGAGSALQLYQRIAIEHYALAILDIGLPDQNGLVIAEYLRNNTEMRIIMLTARTSLNDKLAGYTSGADMYLVKPVDFQELSASISSVLGRISTVSTAQSHPDVGKQAPADMASPSKGENLAWQLDRTARTLCTPQGDVIQLTGKEFDFIACLTSCKSSAVSRQAILQALLYQQDEFSNRSLESLVHRLRIKIAAVSSTVPIKTSHGVGYCFTAPLSLQ